VAPSQAGEDARALAAEYGLDLDPTDTEKAFAAISDAEFTDATVLFWGTLNAVDLSERHAGGSVDQLPAEYRQFFTE